MAELGTKVPRPDGEWDEVQVEAYLDMTRSVFEHNENLAEGEERWEIRASRDEYEVILESEMFDFDGGTSPAKKETMPTYADRIAALEDAMAEMATMMLGEEETTEEEVTENG